MLIREITGACWQFWPNGHPVVRLINGEELDVIALTTTRLCTGQPRLNMPGRLASVAAAAWSRMIGERLQAGADSGGRESGVRSCGSAPCRFRVVVEGGAAS